MKSILALLLLATTVTSIPATFRVHNVPEYALSVESPEDFDWDLQEMRLVQLGPDAEPVWMTELEKVIHTLVSLEMFLMKVDPSQGRGAELYGHVRIYAAFNDPLRGGSQSPSTEAEDLGSLSPVKFQPVGMSRSSNFAYKPPIPPSVSETKRVQGSEASNQEALNEWPQRESRGVYKLPHSSWVLLRLTHKIHTNLRIRLS